MDLENDSLTAPRVLTIPKLLASSLLLGALAPTIGCASLGPAEERSVRTVLQSEKVVQKRAAARLKLNGESRWTTPDVLLASVEQENICSDGYREKVSTTVITSHKTKGIAAETLVGVGLAVAGGVALAVAPQLSDVAADSSEVSPRANARIWGGLGLAGGGALVGHAAWLGVAGMDQTSEPIVTHEVRASDDKPHACGTMVAGPGAVLATVGGRTVPLAAFDSGKEISFNPRAYSRQLCEDPRDQNETAIIKYALKADVGKSIEIGRYSLRRCVTATLARLKTRTAADALRSANDPQRIAQSLKLLAEAQELTASLLKSDPDRASLQDQLGKTRGAAAAKAVAVLTPLIKQTLLKIEEDAASAVQPALDALEVARIANSQDDASIAIYGAFASRTRNLGVPGYVVLARLLDADSATRDCLENGSQCLTNLPQDKLKALLEPTFRAASDAVARDAAQLTTATKAVTKTQSVKTVKIFDGALAAAQAAISACKSPLWVLKANCEPLTEAGSAASSFANSHDSGLAKLRSEITANERVATLKRTTQRWRAHFGECRRLRDGERTLEAISTCDAGCQQIVRRMSAERAKLQLFSYSEIVDDPVALGSLTDECNAAGCESCP